MHRSRTLRSLARRFSVMKAEGSRQSRMRGQLVSLVSCDLSYFSLVRPHQSILFDKAGAQTFSSNSSGRIGGKGDECVLISVLAEQLRGLRKSVISSSSSSSRAEAQLQLKREFAAEFFAAPVRSLHGPAERVAGMIRELEKDENRDGLERDIVWFYEAIVESVSQITTPSLKSTFPTGLLNLDSLKSVIVALSKISRTSFARKIIISELPLAMGSDEDVSHLAASMILQCHCLSGGLVEAEEILFTWLILNNCRGDSQFLS